MQLELAALGVPEDLHVLKVPLAAPVRWLEHVGLQEELLDRGAQRHGSLIGRKLEPCDATTTACITAGRDCRLHAGGAGSLHDVIALGLTHKPTNVEARWPRGNFDRLEFNALP